MTNIKWFEDKANLDEIVKIKDGDITLICYIDGEIVAYGAARIVEEFICVEIPYMNPMLMTGEEYVQWLSEQKGWRIA